MYIKKNFKIKNVAFIIFSRFTVNVKVFLIKNISSPTNVYIANKLPCKHIARIVQII